MSFEDRLENAVTPIVPVCVHGIYTGTSETYCTYDFSESGTLFGDDQPQCVAYSASLHLILPLRSDPRSIKRNLRRALMQAGFLVGMITDASDEDTLHYVFDLEDFDGEV